MPADHALPLDLLACPRTGEALLRDADGLSNHGGQLRFPQLGEIPALFAEPEATLGEWQDRLHLVLAQLEQHAARLGEATGRKDLAPAARARLAALREATLAYREQLADLLAPLALHQRRATVATHLALRTRLPPEASLTGYYANVHRDWAWGDEENEASLSLLRQVADGQPLGRTVVLGAGAGRLAWDVHQQLAPELTLALDFNPLLVLLLARLARGERLALYEFPIAPRRAQDQAVLRELATPSATRPGFHPLLGDALRPPLRAGAFDTVITPWLIDVLPDDPRTQMARINSLLAPGGRWLNLGSLNFNFADPALSFSLEETLELASQAGFTQPGVVQADLPYMCSPASRHGRREGVVAFAATKLRAVKAPPRHQALPDWLVTGREPVPMLAGFRDQAMATRIHLFIMEMIDGRRSLRDMAELMERQRLMTREEAESSLRNFMLRLFEDSQRGRTY